MNTIINNEKTCDFSKKSFVRGTFMGKLVKRRKDGYCQQCKAEIKKGDEVLVVEKNDGYYKKYIGLTHVECFKNLQ